MHLFANISYATLHLYMQEKNRRCVWNALFLLCISVMEAVVLACLVSAHERSLGIQ